MIDTRADRAEVGLLTPFTLSGLDRVLAIDCSEAGLVEALADEAAQVIVFERDGRAATAASKRAASRVNIEIIHTGLEEWLAALHTSEPSQPGFDLIVHRAGKGPPEDGSPESVVNVVIDAAAGLLRSNGTLLLMMDGSRGLGQLLKPTPAEDEAPSAGHGVASLRAALVAGGLTQPRMLIVYPDRGAPDVIVDTRLWERTDGTLLADMFVRQPVTEPLAGDILASDPLATFQAVSATARAAEVADSFMLAAGRGEWPKDSVMRDGYLWKLPPIDRRPEWRPVRELRLVDGDWRLRSTAPSGTLASGPLTLQHSTQDITVGLNGEDVVVAAFASSGPLATDTNALLRAWWNAVTDAVQASPPERFQYDMRVRNFVVGADGVWHFMPQDLTWRFALPRELLVYGALHEAISQSVRRRGPLKDISIAMTIDQAARAIAESIGVPCGEEFGFLWRVTETDIAARMHGPEFDREAYQADLRSRSDTPLWALMAHVPLDRQLQGLLDGSTASVVEEIQHDFELRRDELAAMRRTLATAEAEREMLGQRLERDSVAMARMRRELAYRAAEMTHVDDRPSSHADAAVPDQAERDGERAWLEWQERYQQALEVMSTSGDAGPSGLDADRDIVASSQVFDVDWYVATYPDVGESGVDPAFHFVRHGAAEGRDPGPDFETKAYVARNAEVVALGLNPVVHFVSRTDAGRLSG